MRILIVEDEPFIQDDLQDALLSLGHEVVAVCESYEEVETLLSSNPTIDLAFLDIQLASDLDGIDVAHLLKNHGVKQLVFLSSLSDDRTLKRVKQIHIAGYLVKPFKLADIKTTLALLPTVSEEPKSSIDFLVKDGAEYFKVKASDILYVEACDNYIKLHTANKKWMLNMTMKAAQEKLPSTDFLRAHRSFIVNIHFVDRLGPNYLVIGKEEIPVNEEFKKGFQERFERF